MFDPHIADELRQARLQIVRANRRLALSELEGTVAERDTEKWLVRLEIGRDPETDEKVLSPWLKPQSGSAGAFKVSPALPSVGEKMKMVSPSGEVGAASYAAWGVFDDEQKRPDQEADESVIAFGKTRISTKDDKFAISTANGAAMLSFDGETITKTVGGKGYVLDASELRMTQKFRAKDGSRPAVFKGSTDSGGDINNQGADSILI
ncbi:MAG TPA: hypothetical protein P5256_11020 [Beijerinckiaceae bacterium]|nr:hypothetical protein [Beijerinckiaceae bacterium]